jgi:RHS repeat-associated protein
VPASAYMNKQKLQLQEINIKKPGYLFVYLTYENESNNWVFFDDLKVSYTPGNIIQQNDYYPFGLAMSTSWTRETAVNNNYLYNAGSELNDNTQWYEMFFRGYDPALGRFMQIDPLANVTASLTPYHYGANDPVYWNDPTGLLVYNRKWGEPIFNDVSRVYRNGGPYNNFWSGGGGVGSGSLVFGNNYDFGPTIYNEWCNCNVSATEVVMWDPTNQRATYRDRAQEAIFNYMNEMPDAVKNQYTRESGLDWANSLSSPFVGIGITYLQQASDDILRGTAQLSKAYSNAQNAVNATRFLQGASTVAGIIVIDHTLKDKSKSNLRKIVEVGVTASPWIIEGLAATGIVAFGSTPVGWVAAGAGLIGTAGIMVYDATIWGIEQIAIFSVKVENHVKKGGRPW